MDASKEIQRLLDEHGAALIRDTNHLVYQLPSGMKFTLSKTPSDVRARKNELSILRRLLGVREKEMEEVKEVTYEIVDPRPKMEVDISVPQEPNKSRFVAKMEAEIKDLEERRNYHMQEAARVTAKIDKFTKMLVAVDDPDMLEVMEMLLDRSDKVRKAPIRRVKEVKSSIPANPEHISSPIQVTKQLVLAATQTFGDTEVFETNDLVDRMIGSHPVSEAERQRIRMSIAQAMVKLWKDEGKLIRTEAGFGRQCAKWRKVDMTRLQPSKLGAGVK